LSKETTSENPKEEEVEIKSDAETSSTEEESTVKSTKKQTASKSSKKKGVVKPEDEKYSDGKQAEINIGTIGHVDHGKSTLVKALTGTFPDTHSEELKRGITIRLGYADTDIRYCPKCPEDKKWSTKPTCPVCGEETIIKRRISFVDAP